MANADCTWPGHPHDAETVAEHARKPHERTWTLECADDRGTIHDCWTVSVPTPSAYTDGCVHMSQITLCFYDDEREARLAAQAPAMARLLLAVQWSGRHPHDGEPCCPSCQIDLIYDDDETHVVGPHAPDCELAAVLRAAGVIE